MFAFPDGTGVPGRRRSADWDRVGSEESVAEAGVEAALEFVEREISGDGYLATGLAAVFGVAAAEEDEEGAGEADKYLEETCRPLGFRAGTPLSLRGLDVAEFSCWVLVPSAG